MSPEMKQMLRGAALATVGLILGSLVAHLIPDSPGEFVRSSARAFASGIVSADEASTFALTIGLVVACAVLLACCFVFEVAALLVTIHKIRRNESTDGPGRLLNGIHLMADPLSLGAIGGLVIAVLAFEGHWTSLFASAPWIGPAALLILLTGAFIKRSLKKKVLDHLE